MLETNKKQVPAKSHYSIDDIISSLQESAEKLFQWFYHSRIKGNTDKCHLIGSTDEPIKIRVGESAIKTTPVKNC